MLFKDGVNKSLKWDISLFKEFIAPSLKFKARESVIEDTGNRNIDPTMNIPQASARRSCSVSVDNEYNPDIVR